jgi:DNA-directed RNA polymerase specialized sigma24 family protein
MAGKRKRAKKLLDSVVEEVAAEFSEFKMLKRELRKIALDRIEHAAKTQAEFEAMIEVWDLFEENRAGMDKEYLRPLYTRVKNMETGEDEDYDGIASTDTVFPIPYRYSLRTRYWRQVIGGNFHDYLHDCVETMHLSTSRKDVSEAINRLTKTQKEIFYMIAIEEKTAQEIAEYRGQTSRNIRKIYKCAIVNIHKYLEKCNL